MENYMDNVSSLFWLPVTAIAIFVATRTWPSEFNEGMTVAERLDLRQQKYEFILAFLKRFWGLLIVPLILLLMIAVRLAWTWTAS